ncbi:MAG TPA: multicopper oxidase domain-containing protein [Nitrososphaera sp.]|nr:multicopper oxidase domain-containing protein [Nitrososphaera sp.]
MNRRAIVIILCGILVASVVIGALIPFSGFISIDNDKQIKVGASEAQATANNINSSTTRKEYTLIAQDAELEIAPGKVVKTWTFNGTMPGPPLRFTEGDNVTIKFINKTPIPHTVHMHGNHDDVNDGVHHQIMPNETYLYNITAAPAGALMYHCHAYPTSLHIRMGMYGALIVDPKDNPLPPAKEFVMVMSEYDKDNIMKFETEYYPINGYLDQYVHNPIQVNRDELVRLYVINIGTTIPYQFHLHSTIFKAYPSGLLSNEPIDVQTVSVGPGDATLIEAKWNYPGTYLFHSHGFLEERGNMGQIVVAENNHEDNNNNNQTVTGNEIRRSTSMFDWQYELQKKLQNPTIINYTDAQLAGIRGSIDNNSGLVAHDNTTSFAQPTANATGAAIPEHQLQHADNSSGVIPSNYEISIVEGSSNPSNDDFYDPSPATVKRGNSVTWINNDSIPHTATSGNPGNGEAPTEAIFDTGIIGPGQSSEEITINADTGTYDYYCNLHPYMKGQLMIEE